jgi:phospholipid/cholesterol/gamma-HCH transport system permease protein
VNSINSIPPSLKANQSGNLITLVFYGLWTSANAACAETAVKEAQNLIKNAQNITLDLSNVEKLDTMGAWLLAQLQFELKSNNIPVTILGAREEFQILLNEIKCESLTSLKSSAIIPRLSNILADIGETVVMSGKDLLKGTAFLGSFIVALGRVAINPKRFRVPSLVNQVEKMAFRGAPIIILISFLVGAIIAQQSLFQLSTYGSNAFVADLLGILILRELAVLLTAIMMAGRSGSSITAELGSMKMREEIDALQTMGLDPTETLVIPRVLALVIAMPILTFISSIAGLLGGGIVALVYGGVSPDIFMNRLQAAIGFNTFMVGMIKAPFMAMVIGLIACVEGLAVKGSAESLGGQTTASVVKSIFMVIVVDGLFAMFFAAINY